MPKWRQSKVRNRKQYVNKLTWTGWRRKRKTVSSSPDEDEQPLTPKNEEQARLPATENTDKGKTLPVPASVKVQHQPIRRQPIASSDGSDSSNEEVGTGTQIKAIASRPRDAASKGRREELDKQPTKSKDKASSRRNTTNRAPALCSPSQFIFYAAVTPRADVKLQRTVDQEPVTIILAINQP